MTKENVQCYECGSYNHFRPQCPIVNSQKVEIINRITGDNEELLAAYTYKGKVNWFVMPIFHDIGSTIDIVCEKVCTTRNDDKRSCFCAASLE